MRTSQNFKAEHQKLERWKLKILYEHIKMSGKEFNQNQSFSPPP